MGVIKNLYLFGGSVIFYLLVVMNEAFFSIWGKAPLYIGLAGFGICFVVLGIRSFLTETDWSIRLRKLLRRMHEIVFWAAFALTCFGTVSVKFIGENKPITITEQELNEMIIKQGNDLIVANQERLQDLREERFTFLSEEEQMDVIGTILTIEAGHLGITAPDVTIRELDEEMGGYSNLQEGMLCINKMLLSDIELLLGTICHEMYHLYQAEAVDEFLAEKTDSPLLWAKELRSWSEELGAPQEIEYTDEALTAYYTQHIEISAREYSEKRVENYENVLGILAE